MRLGHIVDWDAVVFPSWQRAARAVKPNSDIWSALPKHVLWFKGEIEPEDVTRTYVIGSADWKNAYGTYRLSELALAPFVGKNDPDNHVARIDSVLRGIDAGRTFEFPIMVAGSGSGPFVIIEGNHRAIAYQKRNLFHGRNVYIGFHARMASDFPWFRSARLRKLAVRVNSPSRTK